MWTQSEILISALFSSFLAALIIWAFWPRHAAPPIPTPVPKPVRKAPWPTAEAAHVAWVQDVLSYTGVASSLVVDGKNGPKTKEAVGVFQRLTRLKVDGIAGSRTDAELAKYLTLTDNLAFAPPSHRPY